MFGLYRYILSTMVVFAHTWPFAPGNATGAYAVFSFYILSGYLMTLVLNEKYGFNWAGLQRYFINRALRIYPPYLTIFALTILSLMIFQKFSIHPHIKIPGTLTEWYTNLTMFNLRIFDDVRTVPPAWSLFIEIAYYIGMGLMLSRKRITYIWFTGSVLFTGYLIYTGADWGYRYFAIPGPSIAFSAGALAYHIKGSLKSFYALPIALIMIANIIYWHLTKYWDGIYLNGFYIHALLSVMFLFTLKGIKAPSWDKRLGDLSYPVFLSHWLVIGIVTTVMGTTEQGMWLFIITLPFTNLLAWGIYWTIEVRINKIRSHVRDISFKATSPPSPALSDGRP